MSRKTITEDRESRAYNWALLATLVLLLSLLVQTPSRVLAHALPATVKPMVLSWGGTVWSGQINWQYQRLQGQLRWSLDLPSLLKLSAGVNWELMTSASHVTGVAATGPGGRSLRGITGHVAGSDLQLLMANWTLPANPVTINSLNLLYKNGAWQGTAGAAEWQGGPLEYVLNGQKQAVTLPPVALGIQGLESRLQLDLTELQGGAGLATFVVNGGMLESRLRQRLLMHAAGYSGVAEPDAVVVTASQPLSGL
jgi:general secretion pathway protein N